MVDDKLHVVICQMMQSDELFACYNRSEGGVVVLDRQGVSVHV